MMDEKFRQYWNPPFQRDINSLNMHIIQLALADLTPYWVNNSAKQPYVRMYYIQSGRAEIHYRDKQIDLLPGNIYLIPSELDYGYSCPDACFKLFCHFTLLRYDKQDMFARVKDCIILENRMPTINEAIRLFRKADDESAVRLKMLLLNSAFEGILASGIALSGFSEYSPLISEAINIINKECRITLTAEELSKRLFITIPALQKQFKTEVGLPLGKYINEVVLRSAENDLKQTNMPIKEISEKYGFSDQFYFSRQFKKYYLFSPSVFRRR